MNNDHLVLLPIILPLTSAAVTLLLYKHTRFQAGWALITMLLSLAASIILLARVWHTSQPAVFQSGGWPAPFGITLVGDLLSVTLIVMSQAVLALGILYATGSKEILPALFSFQYQPV